MPIEISNGGVAAGATSLLSPCALPRVPFVFPALSNRTLLDHLPCMRKAGHRIQIVSGLVRVAVGVLMITAFWLLSTFPAFRSIG